MLHVPSSGNPFSPIWLVGEAPGEEEEIHGKPFIGASGKALDKMLHEVGIDRDQCYVDNVCQWRPPGNKIDLWLSDKKSKLKEGFEAINGRYADKYVVEGRQALLEKLERYRPEMVIGFGNVPLWALSGHWGVMNWRGSELTLANGSHFVPTIHPAAVMRDWSLRPLVVHDLGYRVSRRLAKGFVTPSWQFTTMPSFDEVMERLQWLHDSCLEGHRIEIAADIETSKGHTVCLGIAWSPTEAMSIPFRGPDGVYWDSGDLEQILQQLRRMFNRCKVIGQNWAYDRQYLNEDFRWDVKPDFDTLVAQTVLFPGTGGGKGKADRTLGYLSSMYCDWHEYWKEDGKDWNKGIKDFDKEFRYNCRDACATWEIGHAQMQKLTEAGLNEQFQSRMKYGEYVYRMMRRGVRRDPERTAKMISEIVEAVHEREVFVAEKVGHPVNFDSPKQVSTLFYKGLGCKQQLKRGTGKVTTDDEALKKVSEAYPAVADVALAILESRSLSKLKATFLEAELDPDGQFRSGWMATGTETFRLTSSSNAFYRGGNLQNVTDGKHTHSGRKLPNLRSTIVPPPGRTLFNCDLERADLQVVAWEADDEILKKALKDHLDIHLMNARDLFGLPITEEEFYDPEQVEKLKEKYEQKRHFAKSFVHGTNYGGKARTMAIQCKCSVREAEDGQARWFKAHPGILQWHQRTSAYLHATRTVTNRFGYRRIYFDRIDGILPEALAWVPQSTVSILVSLIQMAIEDAVPEPDLEITMQGHDSIVGHYDTARESEILPAMYAASKILIPYPDPLWIPLELSTSLSSWGEVKGRSWPQS